jgi:hypothetical protein
MKFNVRSLSTSACLVALVTAPSIAEAMTNHLLQTVDVSPLRQLTRQQPSHSVHLIRLAKGHGGEEDLDYHKRHQHNLNGRAG